MHVLIRLAVIWVLIPGSAWNASAQDGPSVDRGRALLEANCAGCHATGKTGESPLTKAPQFRNLSQKYPLANLSEALAEGIMTGHPAMPQFVFSPIEIDSILAYLDSISQR
jgi:cytochrome c